MRDTQARHVGGQGVSQMVRRVGGGQQHPLAASGQAHGQCRGDGGLPDTALAHAQDEPATLLGQFVDQGRQACLSRRRARRRLNVPGPEPGLR